MEGVINKPAAKWPRDCFLAELTEPQRKIETQQLLLIVLILQEKCVRNLTVK